MFLTILLLAVMPLTERVLTFDNFCRGGQDFEFTLLAIAMTLGLLLLLSMQHKRSLTFVFFVQQWLSVVFRSAGSKVERTDSILIDRSLNSATFHVLFARLDLPLLI